MLIPLLAGLMGLELAAEVSTTARAADDLGNQNLDFVWAWRLGHLSKHEEQKLLGRKTPYCILERARARTKLARKQKLHACPACGDTSCLLVTRGERQAVREVIPAVLLRTPAMCLTCGAPMAVPDEAVS